MQKPDSLSEIPSEEITKAEKRLLTRTMRPPTRRILIMDPTTDDPYRWNDSKPVFVISKRTKFSKEDQSE